MPSGFNTAKHRAVRLPLVKWSRGWGISLVMAMFLALAMYSPVAAQTAGPDQFQDMTGYPWAAPDVALLYQEGIVHGTGAASYSPQASLTGEESLVLLYNFFPHATVSSAVYPGVAPWAENAVAWAFHKGIVANPSGFSAAAPAPRAQVVTWMVRALGIPTAGAPAPSFTDAASIPAAYVPFIAAAQADKLVAGGPNGNFHPLEPMTRAQIAAILVQAQYVLARQGKPPLSTFSWQGSSTSTSAFQSSGWVGSAKLSLGSLTAGRISLGPTGSISLAAQERFVSQDGYGTGTFTLSDATGSVTTLWFFYAEPGQGSGNSEGTAWVYSANGTAVIQLAASGNASSWQGTLSTSSASGLLPSAESYTVTLAKGQETWHGTATETLGATPTQVQLTYQGPPLPTPVLFLQQVVAESNLLAQVLGG